MPLPAPGGDDRLASRFPIRESEGGLVIMRGKMDCYGLSDIGKVRQANEDQFLIADLSKSLLVHQTSLLVEDHTRLFGSSQGKLLLVADGMGGHAAGQLASRLAVDTVARYVLNTMPWFLRLRPDQEADLQEELKAALEECQRSVETMALTSPGCRGMGTTLTLAYLLWPRLYVVHAGDSRCYLLRGTRLEQVTRDHTVAQQLVDQGMLPANEVQGSRWSHVLWNCIGGSSHELNPDVYKATLEISDTLLLCTDGLTSCVSEEQIRDLLGQDGCAQETCRRLVDAANERGGRDNITVVVARFRDTDEPPAQAREQAALEEQVSPVPTSPEAEADRVELAAR